MGDFYPRRFTANELFDRALEAQLQVSILRRYRNSPEMHRWWAPTLQAAEQRIQQMLDVIASSRLSDEQKRLSIDAIETDIQATYDWFFSQWAYHPNERASDWGYEFKARKHDVDFVTDPPGGVIRYMPAISWELYKFGLANGRKFTEPKWEIVTLDRVSLAGVFYFYATFDDVKSPVEGPIKINQPQRLNFTPKGLRHRR